MAEKFETGSVSTKFEADIGELLRSFDDIQTGFDGLKEGAEDTEGRMQAMGAALMAAGTSIAVALTGMTVQAAEVDDVFKKMSAQMGLTQDEMDEMRKTFRDTNLKGYAGGMEDTAVAMEQAQFISQRFNEDLQNVSESTIQLKDLFEMEIPESIRAGNAAMNNWNITWDEYVDKITYTRQVAKDFNGDLLDTINEYSPQMAELGYTFDEFNQILINSRNQGVFNLDKAADAIKETGLKLVDLKTEAELLEGMKPLQGFEEFRAERIGTNIIKSKEDLIKLQEKENNIRKAYQDMVTAHDEARKKAVESNAPREALIELGFNPEEISAAIKAGGEARTKAISDIFTAIGNVQDKERNKELRFLFAGAAGEDVGNDFFKQFSEYQNVVMEDQGALDKAWETYTSGNLVVAFRQLIAAIKDLSVSLGSGLIPTLMPVIKGLTAVAHAIGWLLNDIPVLSPILRVLISNFMALAAIVMLVKGAKMVLGNTMTILRGMLMASTVATGANTAATTANTGALALNGTVATTTTARVTALGLAQKAGAIAAGLFRVAMLLTTTAVGALAAGVRALTVAMIANPIGAIIAAVVALGTAIYFLVSKTIGWKKLFEVLGNFFKKVFLGILDGIKWALDGIKTYFTKILPKAILNFINIVTMPIRFLIDMILMPVRLLGKLFNLSIPMLSKFNFASMLGDKGGSGNGNTNVTINEANINGANKKQLYNDIATDTRRGATARA